MLALYAVERLDAWIGREWRKHVQRGEPRGFARTCYRAYLLPWTTLHSSSKSPSNSVCAIQATDLLLGSLTSKPEVTPLSIRRRPMGIRIAPRTSAPWESVHFGLSG